MIFLIDGNPRKIGQVLRSELHRQSKLKLLSVVVSWTRKHWHDFALEDALLNGLEVGVSGYQFLLPLIL